MIDYQFESMFLLIEFLPYYELSRSRPTIVIIIMSEFKVGGTYICTTAHYYNDYTNYKIFYNIYHISYIIYII